MKNLFLILISTFCLNLFAEDSVNEVVKEATEDAVEATENEVGPCKKDIEKLCPGVKPGHGTIRDCLKDKKDQLSQECKDKMAEKKEKAKELKEICSKEVETFCKDVKRGKGKIIKCLKKHQNEASFSSECKSELEKIGGKRKGK